MPPPGMANEKEGWRYHLNILEKSSHNVPTHVRLELWNSIHDVRSAVYFFLSQLAFYLQLKEGVNPIEKKLSKKYFIDLKFLNLACLYY